MYEIATKGASGSLRTADGRRLAYRLVGRGPVMVCHPGGPGFSARYLATLAGLDRSFTLCLLDPRGTGESERPADPRAYSVADYAADLEELRLHLGLEQINLLGHSHGGVAAIAYAAARPERVRVLVLASTFARVDSEQESAMTAGIERHRGEPWFEDSLAALEAETEGRFHDDQELAELVRRELRFYVAHFGKAEAEYLDFLSTEVPNGDALRLFNSEIWPTFDLRSSLEAITAPTLVITGGEDFITGPACARDMEPHLRDCTTVILEGVGHMIFIEAPDRFCSEVASFVGRFQESA
ncbi:MAG: alpha/beta fold hydrolase [Candidatus Dormibacteria bacterium]